MHLTKVLRGSWLGQKEASLFYLGQKSIIFRKVTSSIINHSASFNRISQQANEIVANNLNETEEQLSRKAKISKAMKAYLQRSVEHEKFIAEKITEYEIGKRHLANMMGEDPETFTQKDINEAIRYLLPSGLHEPKARPSMNHPLEDYQRRSGAEFDESGRPFHSLFYTGHPKFYSILQQIAIRAQALDDLLFKAKDKQMESKMNVQGSKFISKLKLEEMLLDKITDDMYEFFVLSFERLIDHPLSAKEEVFILKFREAVHLELYASDIPELLYTEKGVPYMTASGSRKRATAEVTVYGQGSGKITINGDDILYFHNIQDREQIMFPLQFSGMLGSVDIEATVEGGGNSGQSGAIRYALSIALKSFVPPSMAEKMRIAGLLTKDKRRKERQKPGQRRARAKFTWKKR